MRHYWLVALLALAAFVLLVLIVYTWPQPPPPEAETQRVGTLPATPQVVSAETTASVRAAAPDSPAARVEAPSDQPVSWSFGECRMENDAALRSECVGRSLQVRFEAEGRDPTWASATERTIVDGLAGLSTVTKVTMLSVDCRQTVCRLQMGFPALDYVPTNGPPERDEALVSNVFNPLIRSAGLRPLELPERTYYFVRP